MTVIHLKAKDRNRLRRKQDRLLALELPKLRRMGIDPSNVKLAGASSPTFADLQIYIYPEFEKAIDILLEDAS